MSDTIGQLPLCSHASFASSQATAAADTDLRTTATAVILRFDMRFYSDSDTVVAMTTTSAVSDDSASNRHRWRSQLARRWRRGKKACAPVHPRQHGSLSPPSSSDELGVRVRHGAAICKWRSKTTRSFALRRERDRRKHTERRLRKQAFYALDRQLQDYNNCLVARLRFLESLPIHERSSWAETFREADSGSAALAWDASDVDDEMVDLVDAFDGRCSIAATASMAPALASPLTHLSSLHTQNDMTIYAAATSLYTSLEDAYDANDAANDADNDEDDEDENEDDDAYVITIDTYHY
ncbi:hypothetical protein THASP1DRAFT_31777 [Thamnocephalis sphaerospora]|uniref:Uncharacterized protein n=1 Tax=Thamnocephalis sphaerospora TaxID=78915 RepID=A0A4P9XKW1_9FUNG|nr:hypothetical protein THASP1DRAFT_32780 [Thamnocephalis sphaerospora]RKP06402.1 hypothetical protein THASP1DRAFT_31777 [Thamnocephalis sphaerospora]|eukprot:RKP05375.1 hypothetical protein THASP1DRAFT_32780 [Thamnocephalis sphaerospora]